MWPWGHLAVGYLAYSAFTRSRYGDAPTSLGAVLVAFGTLFPDLIDKPLAWTFGVLPSGRTLAHSLLTAVLVIAIAYVLAQRRGRSWVVTAFGVGYVSHLFSDLPPEVLAGTFTDTTYLLWPLLPSPDYDTPQSFLAHFLAFEWTAFEAFQVLLVAIAFVVWIYDDMPGLGLLGRTHDPDPRIDKGD